MKHPIDRLREVLKKAKKEKDKNFDDEPIALVVRLRDLEGTVIGTLKEFTFNASTGNLDLYVERRERGDRTT